MREAVKVARCNMPQGKLTLFCLLSPLNGWRLRPTFAPWKTRISMRNRGGREAKCLRLIQTLTLLAETSVCRETSSHGSTTHGDTSLD